MISSPGILVHCFLFQQRQLLQGLILPRRSQINHYHRHHLPLYLYTFDINTTTTTQAKLPISKTLGLIRPREARGERFYIGHDLSSLDNLLPIPHNFDRLTPSSNHEYSESSDDTQIDGLMMGDLEPRRTPLPSSTTLGELRLGDL